MSEFSFRLAKPADAEALSRWVAENPQIDPKDAESASKKANPTVVYFVVEKDKVPVMFCPAYCQMTVPHLAFSPEANVVDRKGALATMLDGLSAFAVQFGVREITTMSKVGYPVAQWALENDFTVDKRQQFKFDINKVLALAAKE